MKGIRDLLIDELHDMLSCEKQIVVAFPEMIKAAKSEELKSAFQGHLKETKGQVNRLNKIFKLMKVKSKTKFCMATKGLIQECKQVLKDFTEKSPLRDAALISKAQRIEHYEIAAYGTVRTFAKELELDQVVDLLAESLNEEGNADKKLTKIAEGGIFRTGINELANKEVEKKAEDKKNKPIPQKRKVMVRKKSTKSTSKTTTKRKVSAARR